MSHPEPPFPPIPRVWNNVRAKQQQPAKDHDAYELLRRIENVAETWCFALLQHKQQTTPDASNQERERIIHFCHRTLQQIVASKNRKKNPSPHSGNSSDPRTTSATPDPAATAANSDVSPPLQQIPLPLWNLLPGAVMALHYWYHQVARRCQYRESVQYFARLLTAAHGDPKQQQRYVQICETQAQLALSVQVSTTYPPHVTTSTTNSKGIGLVTPMQDPEGVNYSIVDAAKLHVQQCLSSKAPTMKNSQPSHLHQHQHQHQHRHHRHLFHQQERSVDRSSPQSVVLLDHQDCWVPAIVPKISPFKSNNPPVHPVAVKPNTPNETKVVEPIAPVPGSSEILACLFHASRCRHPSNNNVPCFFENCAAYKSLWDHIVKKNCCNDSKYKNTGTSSSDTKVSAAATANGKEQTQRPCVTPQCFIAKQSLRHFRKCKHPSCIVCGPVLQLIPKLKQDIEQVQHQQSQRYQPVPTTEELCKPVPDNGRADWDGGVNEEGQQNLKENSGTTDADMSVSDNAATADWTATAEASPPTGPLSAVGPTSKLLPPSPSTSPLRRSSLKRKSNRGPLKKRHRVKFASSYNDNSINDTPT